MKINGNEATLRSREREAFGLDARTVPLSDLNCWQTIEVLQTTRDILCAKQAELPARGLFAVPYAHSIFSPYTSEINKLNWRIEVATRVGAQVMVHEIEQYLSEPPGGQAVS